MKDKAFFTPEEAAAWEQQVTGRNQEPEPGHGTGTYNTFFREFGTRTVKTLRTSIITDPPDGRIPALTPAAAEVKQRRLAGIKNPASAQETGLQDRCLAMVTAGPPMLPYSYNSNYQIIQTSDSLVIHVEMIHDTRIIRLDGRPHLPSSIRLWKGDSVGRWEGDTLVVDTTNFNDGGGFYGDAGGNFGWDRNLHLDRAVQPARQRHAAVPIRGRQPHRVHATLEGRADDDAVDRTDVRIRLPRRQLRVAEHAQRRTRHRTPVVYAQVISAFANDTSSSRQPIRRPQRRAYEACAPHDDGFGGGDRGGVGHSCAIERSSCRHLDVERSEEQVHSGPTPKSITSVYEAAGKGYKVTVKNDTGAGTVHTATRPTWTARTRRSPATIPMRIPWREAHRRLDARGISKKNGKVTITQRSVVSADGKTRTVTTTGTDALGQNVNNVAVFERKDT